MVAQPRNHCQQSTFNNGRGPSSNRSYHARTRKRGGAVRAAVDLAHVAGGMDRSWRGSGRVPRGILARSVGGMRRTIADNAKIRTAGVLAGYLAARKGSKGP